MTRRPSMRTSGFTLVELMIGVAVMAVLLMIAAPSFRELIEMQRLRGTHAQLVTDVQFARSEAVGRATMVGITFGATAGVTSCYTVHACPAGVLASACKCTCTAAANSRCTAPVEELRTVRVPADSGVVISPILTASSTVIVNPVHFDPVTGGIAAVYSGVGGATFDPSFDAWVKTSLVRGGDPPSLRTMISVAGRPSACAPSGKVTGVTPCP